MPLLRSLLPAFVVLITLGACGDAPSVAKPPSVDGMLETMANEAGLAVVDVSVPFERFMQAPEQLQAVNRALQTGPPGAYVMRYSDDTLRHTRHVFLIEDSKRVYIRLSTAPLEDITREEHVIDSARYDDEENSLILDTPVGVIRLTPQDVTPVGA